MSEPVTIIGASTVISGNVEGDEDLTVAGRIEGSVSLSKTLTIEANGQVHANVDVRHAVVSGVMVGNVKAVESVHITEEGRMMGDICAPRVVLAEGACFSGNIDMGDFGVAPDEAKADDSVKKTAPVKRKAPKAVPQAARETTERAPTRVRKAPAARKAVRPSSAPAPSRKKAPAPAAKKRKPAPVPKVRSVGKARAAKKTRDS